MGPMVLLTVRGRRARVGSRWGDAACCGADMVLIRSRHDAPRMRINSYPEDVVRKVGMGMLAGFPAIVHETHRAGPKIAAILSVVESCRRLKFLAEAGITSS